MAWDCEARRDTVRLMVEFPLPGASEAVVAIAPPGAGAGYWAEAPSAALDEDGTFVVASARLPDESHELRTELIEP
jgi:hypothetical protein